MKLRFLCGTHRADLTARPARAIYYCQNGFETGQLLCDQGHCREALPHVGCAYETAEIVLTSKALATDIACEQFADSAMLLAELLLQLDMPEQSQEVYRITMTRLVKELSLQPAARQSINLHLRRLAMKGRSQANGSSYERLDHSESNCSEPSYTRPQQSMFGVSAIGSKTIH